MPSDRLNSKPLDQRFPANTTTKPGFKPLPITNLTKKARPQNSFVDNILNAGMKKSNSSSNNSPVKETIVAYYPIDVYVEYLQSLVDIDEKYEDRMAKLRLAFDLAVILVSIVFPAAALTRSLTVGATVWDLGKEWAEADYKASALGKNPHPGIDQDSIGQGHGNRFCPF